MRFCYTYLYILPAKGIVVFMTTIVGNSAEDQQLLQSNKKRAYMFVIIGGIILISGIAIGFSLLFNGAPVGFEHMMASMVPIYVGAGGGVACFIIGLLFARRNYSITIRNVTPRLAGTPQTIVKVKCPGCGGLNDENATFCSSCGLELVR